MIMRRVNRPKRTSGSQRLNIWRAQRAQVRVSEIDDDVEARIELPVLQQLDSNTKQRRSIGRTAEMCVHEPELRQHNGLMG